MADKTLIEWCDASWPIVAGCDRVSAGCAKCWAIRTTARLAGNPNPKVGPLFQGLVERKNNGQLDWTGTVRPLPGRLDWPLKWKAPRRIFVASQSDLFHEDVPDEFIDRVFAAMADAHQHTFQILTKRPERMRDYLSPDNPRYTARRVFDLTRGEAGKFDCDIYWPLPNAWLGCSVEDQKTADERIPLLLQTPAAVRWCSYEPALGPIDFLPLGNLGVAGDPGDFGLNWVVAGSESGPGARPAQEDWFRSVRDQCQAEQVAFFYKQWAVNGKKVPTPELDGKRWMEYPEVRA